MQNEECKVKSEVAPHGIQHSAFCVLHLRRAFTLVELLIVIAIISMVTLASVPMVLPALDSRRIRESARIVSTQFASAQSEAMAKGRSVGVWIDKLKTGGPSSGTVEGEASKDLFLCEVPQPYAGDASGSVAMVSVASNGTQSGVITSPGGQAATVTKYKGSFTVTDSGWVGLLKPGDVIRFAYRGASYRLLQGTNQLDSNGYFKAPSGSGPASFDFEPVDQSSFIYNYPNNGQPTKVTPVFAQLPPAASVAGWSAPFQISFQPVKSSGSPISLPGSAVVDLYFSGMGSTLGEIGTDKNPVLVIFSRTGALESVYENGIRQDVTGPLYFLIGKRDKLQSLGGSPTDHNWADSENIWVSINPQTGLVTTAEVAATTSPSLPASRKYAQAAQTMGGR